MTTVAHRAIERLVGHLPPKERACVLLKDVFDYSLEETAELVDSTVGGVKSALSRGPAKLADLPAEPIGEPSRQLDPDTTRLLQRYVDLFNRHDWMACGASSAPGSPSCVPRDFARPISIALIGSKAGVSSCRIV